MPYQSNWERTNFVNNFYINGELVAQVKRSSLDKTAWIVMVLNHDDIIRRSENEAILAAQVFGRECYLEMHGENSLD